ncbi:HesA/MoeB/ThiF family protein [Candidatus Micrarchaeota archaeon]|nr:HesA/MoeB/ThiF family protein [Candidatus Micrarchaeota archaeon]
MPQNASKSVAETRFSRQVIALGREAQRRLARAKFALVGVGGIGSYSALLLAQAGAGEIRLIDRDVVEESNLPRQCLFGEESVGKPKAVAAGRVLSKVKGAGTRVLPVFEQFSHGAAEKLLRGVDVVLDCSDNYGARIALNEFCWRKRVPWVYAGAVGFRAMVSAVVPPRTPCFACWTVLENRVEAESCVGRGVFNTTVSQASCVQVQAAVDLVCRGKSELEGKLFFADVRKGFFRVQKLSRRRYCPVCGK